MYINNKTGKKFNTIEDAMFDYMCPGSCNDCSFTSVKGDMYCVDWAKKNENEAAKIIGLEYINEYTVLSLLALQPQQRFKHSFFPLRIFHFDGNDNLWDDKGESVNANVLIKILNNKEGITVLNEWTEQEILDAKYLLRFFNVEKIKRTENKLIVIYSYGKEIEICYDLFSTIKTGQEFNLIDIAERHD